MRHRIEAFGLVVVGLVLLMLASASLPDRQVAAQSPGPSSPWYNVCQAITTSDTLDLPFFNTNRLLTSAVYVGGAGNVVAVLNDGTTATFTAPVLGQFLPVGTRRINATNTTATLLLACYRF